MTKKVEEKRGFLKDERVWLILCSVLCFMVHVMTINQFNGWFCTDTDGYWLHAATFTGHDWSGAARTANYFYSWGYSLILTIPFVLADDILVMSKIAVILNSFFCALTVPLFYSMGKKLFQDINKKFILMASTITSLYSSYFLLSAVALAESFLYFLYVLLMWFVFKFLDTEKNSWGILSAICCGYLYCTHHRTLGVVVAYVLMILILFFKNRNVKQLLCFLLPLIIMLCMDGVLNNWLMLQENTGNVYTVNTYSSMSRRGMRLFSLKAILYLVQNILGQAWYVLAGTFAVGGIGVTYIIRQMKEKVSHGKAKEGILKNIFIFYGYILLNIVMMLGVSIIGAARFTNDIYRMDFVFYGRYFEFTICMLLFFGLIALYKIRKDIAIRKDIEIVLLLMLCLSVLTHFFVQEISGDAINYFSVTAVLFPFSHPNVSFSIIGTSICTFSIAVLIIRLCLREEIYYRLAAFMLIAFGFIYIGYNAVINVRDIYVEQANLSNSPSVNHEFIAMNEYLANNQIDEFYVHTEDKYVGMSFQLFNIDAKVISISNMEQTVGRECRYIIMSKKCLEGWTNIEILMETDMYAICAFIE